MLTWGTITYLLLSVCAGLDETSWQSTLNTLKSNLKKPYIGYVWQLIGEEYRDMGGKNTFLNRLMKSMHTQFHSKVTNTCAPEFELEYQACQAQNAVDAVFFPPLAVANDLLMSFNSNMDHHNRANEALNDFYELVHRDEENHFHEECRAVSLGDHQAAFRSFTSGLHHPYNNFNSVPITRLLVLLYNVLHSSNSTL